MGTRLELHEVLEGITGVTEAYFQPPASIQLVYPCIIYARDQRHVEYADDKPYMHKKRYQVTIIDKNPDSNIPDLVAELPLSSFNRHFKADNLNHDIYTLYF